MFMKQRNKIQLYKILAVCGYFFSFSIFTGGLLFLFCGKHGGLLLFGFIPAVILSVLAEICMHRSHAMQQKLDQENAPYILTGKYR